MRGRPTLSLDVERHATPIGCNVFMEEGTITKTKQMKNHKSLLALFAAAAVYLLSPLSASLAEDFGGIEFPEGVVSFADEVIDYDAAAGGGSVPTDPNFLDPREALGAPDYLRSTERGSVSLGDGGYIVLKFSDNKLTGSDTDEADLHIFEVGTQTEQTFVEISPDGTTWHSVGKIIGATSSIDIDAFGFTSQDEFSYVRLTDNPDDGENSGRTVGADIDAVGAISTTPVPQTPDLEIAKAVILRFQSTEGSSYTIEESSDNENWTDAVTNINGDGTTMEFCFEILEMRKFYRLKPGSP